MAILYVHGIIMPMPKLKVLPLYLLTNTILEIHGHRQPRATVPLESICC